MGRKLTASPGWATPNEDPSWLPQRFAATAPAMRPNAVAGYRPFLIPHHTTGEASFGGEVPPSPQATARHFGRRAGCVGGLAQTAALRHWTTPCEASRRGAPDDAHRTRHMVSRCAGKGKRGPAPDRSRVLLSGRWRHQSAHRRLRQGTATRPALATRIAGCSPGAPGQQSGRIRKTPCCTPPSPVTLSHKPNLGDRSNGTYVSSEKSQH